MDTFNKRLVQLTSPVTEGSEDVNAPYSFKGWYQRHRAIDPSQGLLQYNVYLSEWYKSREQDRTDSLSLLQQRFLSFLRQVQIFFLDTDVLKWYNNIDFSNERDLLIAIPYFSRKLKDIALYYTEARKHVKDSKLRNSIAGTNISISKNVQQLLVDTFLKKQFHDPVVINNNIWNSIPDLSAVVGNLRITVTDMYDDNTYFDGALESSLLSAVPLVSEAEAADFLLTKNLTLSASDWLHTSILQLTETTNNFIPSDRRNLLKGLANNLIANDIYKAESLSSAPISDDFVFNFTQGKNFFYWPVGPFKQTAPKYYKPLPLSASGLEDRGTPGITLEEADTIFIKTKDGVQGAWLTLYTYSAGVSTMRASINTIGDTIFKFPYPGYGLSAIDIPWTGPSFVSEPNFVFLSDEDKRAVERAYWDFTSATVSSIAIEINDSTLANVAHSSLSYISADKVRTWDSIPSVDNSMFSGDINEAWLYTYNTTDLPLSTTNTTTVYWPYVVVDSEVGIPETVPDATSTVCSSVPISSVLHVGIIAGDLPTNSNIVYKISNFSDPANTITEGAWLKGATATGVDSVYIKQPGFNLKANPRAFTKFVWSGPNTTLRDIFNNTGHTEDCNYILNRTTYKDAMSVPGHMPLSQVPTTSADPVPYTGKLPDQVKCTCMQPYFNSFGHPGNTFDEFNRQADFFAQVAASSTEIDLTNWKGRDNKDYQQSADFAWYRTNLKLDWGTGVWTNNITLSTGVCYAYTRAEYNDVDTTITSMPFLRKLYDFTYNKDDFKWIGVQKNSDGEWISSNEKESSMVLYPGNLLSFVHKPSFSQYSTQISVTQEEIRTNTGSMWSNYDRVSLNNTNPILVSVPNVALTIPDSQLPIFDLTKVVNASWSVRYPDSSEAVYNNTMLVSFTPQSTGVYTITLTAEVLSSTTASLAFSTDNLFTYENQINPQTTSLYVFSGIPSITAVMPFTYSTVTTPFSTTTCGYTLNHRLSGWSYDRTTAKPFWAKGITNTNKVESMGVVRKFDGEMNILSQPQFSDIKFDYNTYTQIINTHGTPYIWVQPVVSLSAGESVVWNKLDLQRVDFNLQNETIITGDTTVVSATHIPSDLAFEVQVSNAPVEVFYNAIDDLSWAVSLTTSSADDSTYLNIAGMFKANQPWLNILNKFKPTIATYPLISNLQSTDYISEYFKPKQMGVTTYIGKDSTITVQSSSGMFSYNKYFPIGGYGLGNNTDSFYTVTREDSTWLKEPIASQAGAGNVSKAAYTTHQKFVPYQSFYETSNLHTLGVLSPNSKQSPWDDTSTTTRWGDSLFKFTNLPGIVNTDTWAKKQILKQESVKLDQWCSDLYNNQYGLYKDSDSTTGVLWVKTPQLIVKNSYEVLSGVFDKHKNQQFYTNLHIAVEYFDVFVDTLYIKLKNAFIFERVYYSPESDSLNNNYVDSVIYVITPLTNNLTNYNTITTTSNVLSKPWYLDKLKKVLLVVCEKNVKITVFEYNLHTHTCNILYVYTNFLSVGNYKEFKDIETVILNYDTQLNNFNILLWGSTVFDKKQLFVLTCSYQAEPTIKREVCYSEYNNSKQNIFIVSNLHHTVEKGDTINIPLSVSENREFECELLTSNATYSNNTVTFTSESVGVHYIPFKLVLDQAEVYDTITVKVL